jgi:hypothetical protein
VFRSEFSSVLVVLPILWVVGRALHIDTDELELVAAPVILAWFAARGRKTVDIWRFIAKFLLATGVVVGLPLLLYSIMRGIVLLVKSPDPPYLTLLASLLAVAASSMLFWFGRNEALALGLRWLGLSDATTGRKARFAVYWLVSLVLVAAALRGNGPQFDSLCASAREAGAKLWEVTTSMEGLLYSGCEIRPQGEGYAVTIGAVPEGKDGRPIRFRAIVKDGFVNQFKWLGGDPRGSGEQ